MEGRPHLNPRSTSTSPTAVSTLVCKIITKSDRFGSTVSKRTTRWRKCIMRITGRSILNCSTTIESIPACSTQIRHTGNQRAFSTR
jgi:hypothetical protein